MALNDMQSPRQPGNEVIYKGIVTQFGVGAPTIVKMQDETPEGDLSFSRAGVGLYQLDSASGIFTANKTFVHAINPNHALVGNEYGAGFVIEDEFTISIYTYTLEKDGVTNEIKRVASDNILSSTPFQVEIYN